MELQRLGLRFRDEGMTFAGAPFRDDKTKIMYAYDDKTRTFIRLGGGANIKKYMRAGLAKEINVSLYERVMINGAATEGGKSGTRVNGAVAEGDGRI